MDKRSLGNVGKTMIAAVGRIHPRSREGFVPLLAYAGRVKKCQSGKWLLHGGEEALQTGNSKEIAELECRKDAVLMLLIPGPDRIITRVG